ncbi:MAG TPA: CCA tRNA nucleotidyltransferase [Thermodesulfobacteriota bacterium]|nr:CCA tRNA nucleotidyltransferase [Thermodesulfobacteriota bacterium]
MKKVIKIKPFESELFDIARHLVTQLKNAGYKAFCVGGCTRDMLMNVPPKEYDITTSATPEEVSDIFPHTIPVGVSFGVILVLIGHYRFEVATFRKDEGYSDSRHPDYVTYSTDEEEDVLRRDFTINGMLYDPIGEEAIDFVGGMDDIRDGIIRTIGIPYQRFDEDKLRLMRAVRFASRYGFAIERDTYGALRELASQINLVSAERIRDELVKIITQSNPGDGLGLLRETGLLRYILPEVDIMHGVEQPPEFHPEGDVFTHTCLVLDKIYENTGGLTSPELAMGGLLHDVGKPPTFSVSDRIRFNGHDKLGAEMSREICRRLKFSNKQTELIFELVRDHLKFKDVFYMKKSTLKRFIGTPDFEEHMVLHLADCLASHGSTEAYDFVMQKFEEFKDEEIKPEPLIGGRELIEMGYTPGPLFKEILNLVEEAQLEGEITNRSEALELVSRKYPIGKNTG